MQMNNCSLRVLQLHGWPNCAQLTLKMPSLYLLTGLDAANIGLVSAARRISQKECNEQCGFYEKAA